MEWEEGGREKKPNKGFGGMRRRIRHLLVAHDSEVRHTRRKAGAFAYTNNFLQPGVWLDRTLRPPGKAPSEQRATKRGNLGIQQHQHSFRSRRTGGEAKEMAVNGREKNEKNSVGKRREIRHFQWASGVALFPYLRILISRGPCVSTSVKQARYIGG